MLGSGAERVGTRACVGAACVASLGGLELPAETRADGDGGVVERGAAERGRDAGGMLRSRRR